MVSSSSTCSSQRRQVTVGSLLQSPSQSSPLRFQPSQPLHCQ